MLVVGVIVGFATGGSLRNFPSIPVRSWWFAVTGISNGLSVLTLFAAVRNGPITLVAPLVAVYPLVTVLLSFPVLRS